MASARRQPLGKRLYETAPWLYRLVGPAGRAVQRIVTLRDAEKDTASYRAEWRAGAPQAPESPRVLFDGAAFSDPHSGIARLWSAIMHEWSASGFASHVVVLDRAATAPKLDGFTYLAAPPLRAFDAASTCHLIDAACEATNAHIFISSTYTHPSTHPSVLYLYDMTPEVLGWDLRVPQWREKTAAIDHSSAYLCLSNSTDRDLVRFHPGAAEKPRRLALPGVGPEFGPASPEAVADLRARLALPRDYFVFLGHRDSYKNADLLFDAIQGLPDDYDADFLLVGGAPVLERVHAEKAGGRTVRIARLTDDELRAAYTGASALLYLSRYEGFGLPVTEAMACECPVVTCRNSSLPEAAGDAAVFVSESDPAGLRAAMEAVREPSRRADLISRGLEWSRTFDWAHTAAVVAAALMRCASEPEDSR